MNSKIQDLVDKTEKLGKKDSVTPGMNTYLNILGLINNLKIIKTVKEDKTTYGLQSLVQKEDSEEFSEFYEQLRQQVTNWMIVNESRWFEELVRIAEKTIREIEQQ